MLAIACSGVFAVHAADNSDAARSLPQLIDELKRDNPQLEQARQAYRSARQLVVQVDGLPAPQLSLSEQANTGGPFDFNRRSGFYAYPTLTQPFLWPGKTALNAAMLADQAEAIGHQYDSLEIALIAQLKLAFYQLNALQDQLRFMDEDQQRLQQIQQLAQIRYANNAAGYVDFLNAQVASSSLENDRYGLQKQIQQQIELIDNLLGRSSQAPLQVLDADRDPQLPAEPLDALIERAQKSNPQAASSQAQLSAADKGLQLAHKAYWPDFALSAGLYTDPSLLRADTTRAYLLSVSVNLPTWGFRREKAGVDQAQAQLDGARAGQAAVLQQLDLQVANAYHTLETALQQIRFVRERLLPQAQAAYRLALTGYGSNGGTGFADLLTAQSQLRATELGLVQAQNSAVQASISLFAAVGKDPG